MKLIIVFSRSVKNCVGILMGIAFGRITIFIILILPIQEYGRSFHFLVSSSISFTKDLKFLPNRSFTSFVSVTPRYFMLFVAIVKGDLSLIFFSASLSLYIGGLLSFFSYSYILPHY